MPVLQHGAASLAGIPADVAGRKAQTWWRFRRRLPPNSRKSVRTNGLQFPILSDTHNDVAGRPFGLRFELPDYLIELYKNLRNDLPTFNDDPSWTLPMPAALCHRSGWLRDSFTPRSTRITLSVRSLLRRVDAGVAIRVA